MSVAEDRQTLASLGGSIGVVNHLWGPHGKNCGEPLDAESGPQPAPGRKTGTSVQQVQGNEILQQLVSLDVASEDEVRTTASAASWFQLSLLNR